MTGRPGRRALALLAVALMAMGAAPAAAQRTGAPPRRQAAPQRETLLAQVQRQMAELIRRRLELTDSQFQRVVQVNRKYDVQRRNLQERERATRQELRSLVAADSADQRRVAALVDTMMAVQRRRLDLLQQEQRDLAEFLTPVQRAKYIAVQEQIRRRLEEMRQRREQRLAPPPRGGWQGSLEP